MYIFGVIWGLCSPLISSQVQAAWLSAPTNAAPLAFIISSFCNRQRLMDYIFQGRTMVAVKRGNRWALIPEDCSARVEILAKRHLLGG